LIKPIWDKTSGDIGVEKRSCLRAPIQKSETMQVIAVGRGTGRGGRDRKLTAHRSRNFDSSLREKALKKGRKGGAARRKRERGLGLKGRGENCAFEDGAIGTYWKKAGRERSDGKSE